MILNNPRENTLLLVLTREELAQLTAGRTLCANENRVTILCAQAGESEDESLARILAAAGEVEGVTVEVVDSRPGAMKES